MAIKFIRQWLDESKDRYNFHLFQVVHIYKNSFFGCRMLQDFILDERSTNSGIFFSFFWSLYLSLLYFCLCHIAFSEVGYFLHHVVLVYIHLWMWIRHWTSFKLVIFHPNRQLWDLSRRQTSRHSLSDLIRFVLSIFSTNISNKKKLFFFSFNFSTFYINLKFFLCEK